MKLVFFDEKSDVSERLTAGRQGEMSNRAASASRRKGRSSSFDMRLSFTLGFSLSHKSIGTAGGAVKATQFLPDVILFR